MQIQTSFFLFIYFGSKEWGFFDQQEAGGIAGYILECITTKLGSVIMNIFKTLCLFLGKPGQIELNRSSLITTYGFNVSNPSFVVGSDDRLKLWCCSKDNIPTS